jgi:hypothetical protein
LLATLFGQFPFLAKLFADSAYAGSIFHTALTKALPNLAGAGGRIVFSRATFAALFRLRYEGPRTMYRKAAASGNSHRYDGGRTNADITRVIHEEPAFADDAAKPRQPSRMLAVVFYFFGFWFPKAASNSSSWMRAAGLPRSSRFCSSVPSPIMPGWLTSDFILVSVGIVGLSVM